MIPPLVPLAYFKREPFYGSYKGLQYRVAKHEDMLRATIYPAPYCFDATQEEQKESRDFPFTDESRAQIVEWLNTTYEDRKEEWTKASKFS